MGWDYEPISVAESVIISAAIVDPMSATISSPTDDVTGNLISIDQAHHEIHDGDHFFYTDSVLLGNAATQDYLITTPDTTKYCHLFFVLDGSTIVQWDLYESSDKLGTTPQTAFNSNRNSLTAPTLAIAKGTSGGTTDGTLLQTYKCGSSTAQAKSPTLSRNIDEIILKRNTKYILRTTSGAASNLTNVRLTWYEHVNAT